LPENGGPGFKQRRKDGTATAFRTDTYTEEHHRFHQNVAAMGIAGRRRHATGALTGKTRAVSAFFSPYVDHHFAGKKRRKACARFLSIGFLQHENQGGPAPIFLKRACTGKTRSPTTYSPKGG